MMFWQHGPNEREREQRERERERNHGRTPSANNGNGSQSANGSAASSRSSSMSRHGNETLFDSSTIRAGGRVPPPNEANFAALMDGAPNGITNTSSASASNSGGGGKKIWVPPTPNTNSNTSNLVTPKAPRSRNDRSDRNERVERVGGSDDREPPPSGSRLAITATANSTTTSPAIHPLSLTLSSASANQNQLVPTSNSQFSQSSFYAVSERARDDRLRVRAGEFRNRAEVVAAFQRRVEDLMAEFAEAITRVDEYERFGPSSALTSSGAGSRMGP